MEPVDVVGETQPSSCPPSEQLVELAGGRLDDARARSIEQHIDLCPTCRVALGQLARGETAPWQLGRYRIDRVLGSGGMGIVYLAHDPALGREVAIKVVRSEADRSLAERLEREAKALARLSHPNVCHVYDVGTEGGEVWIAMELIRGATMRDWLATRPALREILEILTGVARGLEAAHAAGLVHRDVKPENVLVERGGRPVVSDFGLAQVIDGTRSSALAGTPAYMAPEQLDGQSADARSDQYAFAVMAHEALAGARPRPRDVASAMLPPGVRAVLERALADDPEARFPGVTALVEALAAAIAEAGMGDSRTLVPANLAVGSAGPLAKGSAAPAPASPGVVAQPAVSAPPRPARRALVAVAVVGVAAIAAAAVGGWWFARRGTAPIAAPAGAPAPIVAASPPVAPPTPPAAVAPVALSRPDAAVPPAAVAPADAAPRVAVSHVAPTMPSTPSSSSKPPPLPAVVSPHAVSSTPTPPHPAPTGTDPSSLLMIANSKIAAHDGPGCVAAFAAFDQAGGLPGAEATVDSSRAICDMLAGHCDAGRKAAVALQEKNRISHDQASSYADALISMYCAAPVTDRDRLLRALWVLTLDKSKHTLAACRRAYKAALALAPSYEPVSPSDMARGAVTRLREAPKCFALAGSCAEAWQAAKEIDERAPLVAGVSTDLSRRQVFQMAVRGACYDRDQGPMNDTEILYRESRELSGARSEPKLTIAWCKARMDRALKAFASAGTRELAYELTGYSAQCIAAAGDCTGGWVPYASFARALGDSDAQAREMFKANRCGIPLAP